MWRWSRKTRLLTTPRRPLHRSKDKPRSRDRRSDDRVDVPQNRDARPTGTGLKDAPPDGSRPDARSRAPLGPDVWRWAQAPHDAKGPIGRHAMTGTLEAYVAGHFAPYADRAKIADGLAFVRQTGHAVARGAGFRGFQRRCHRRRCGPVRVPNGSGGLSVVSGRARCPAPFARHARYRAQGLPP